MTSLPALYGDDLVAWYYLIDPRADHADEAAVYGGALLAALGGAAGERPTLLELGAGAGNNAWYLKDRFACTLTDLSPAMLALSRAQNPECEHVLGDMRTLRLASDGGATRLFDAVWIHDAIAYMTSEADLAAAIATAFAHTRPGGVALFAPDCLADTFAELSQLHENDDVDGAAHPARSLRCLEWHWDPDESDTTCVVEYAFLLRERAADGTTTMRAVHDRHLEGLFARATWERLLAAAGYAVTTLTRPLDDVAQADPFTAEVFLCRRPAAAPIDA